MARALMKDPEWEYGSILPIATRKGEISLALPDILRDPLASWVKIRNSDFSDYDQQDVMNIMPIPGAAGAAGVPKAALGMFGGRLAATADKAMLRQAEEMAAQGVPREEIWKATGWFQGVDGKWRFEIDDSQARLMRSTGDMQEGKSQPLGDVYAHEDFYSAYPDTADTRFAVTQSYHPSEGAMVRLQDGRSAIVAGYDPTRRTKSDLGALSSIPHELQHVVQEREGFAVGGSPTMGHPMADVQREAQQAYEAKLAHQRSGVRTETDELLAELGMEPPPLTKEWSNLTPREQMDWYDAGRGRAYHKLAGETEARTVQKRLNLSSDERRARPPWLDYDVPEADQIARVLMGKN